MDSYNSTYPVEYYQIGTPYMFYGNSFNIARAATPSEIKKFAKDLDSQKPQHVDVPAVQMNLVGHIATFNLQRVIGICIEKCKVLNSQDAVIGYLIGAMMKNAADEGPKYFVKYYTVNAAPKDKAVTDDLEILSAEPSVKLTGELTEPAELAHNVISIIESSGVTVDVQENNDPDHGVTVKSDSKGTQKTATKNSESKKVTSSGVTVKEEGSGVTVAE